MPVTQKIGAVVTISNGVPAVSLYCTQRLAFFWLYFEQLKGTFIAANVTWFVIYSSFWLLNALNIDHVGQSQPQDSHWSVCSLPVPSSQMIRQNTMQMISYSDPEREKPNKNMLYRYFYKYWIPNSSYFHHFVVLWTGKYSNEKH